MKEIFKEIFVKNRKKTKRIAIGSGMILFAIILFFGILWNFFEKESCDLWSLITNVVIWFIIFYLVLGLIYIGYFLIDNDKHL